MTKIYPALSTFEQVKLQKRVEHLEEENIKLNKIINDEQKYSAQEWIIFQDVITQEK